MNEILFIVFSFLLESRYGQLFLSLSPPFPKDVTASCANNARTLPAGRARMGCTDTLGTKRKTPADIEPAGADLKARQSTQQIRSFAATVFLLKNGHSSLLARSKRAFNRPCTGGKITYESSSSTPVASFCIHLLRYDTRIVFAQFVQIKRILYFIWRGYRLLSQATQLAAVT